MVKNNVPPKDTWTDLENRLFEQTERQNMKTRAALVDEIQTGRETKNMSLRQLAEITGIKHPVISRFESGITDPRLSTIVTLLTALGLELTVQPIRTVSPVPQREPIPACD